MRISALRRDPPSFAQYIDSVGFSSKVLLNTACVEHDDNSLPLRLTKVPPSAGRHSQGGCQIVPIGPYLLDERDARASPRSVWLMSMARPLAGPFPLFFEFPPDSFPPSVPPLIRTNFRMPQKVTTGETVL